MALEPALSCISTRCGASISESESLSLATKWAYPEVCLEDPGPDAVEAPVVDVTLHIIELADVFYAISGIHEKQMGISFLQMYVSRLGLRPIPSTASSLQQCLELCAPASTRSFSTYTCPLCAAAWGQLQRAPSLAGRLTKSEQRCALSSRGFFCFFFFFCFFCFSVFSVFSVFLRHEASSPPAPFSALVFPKKRKQKRGLSSRGIFFFSEIKSNQITPNRTKKRKFRHKLKPEQIGGSYSFFINLSEEQNMFSLEK